MMEAHQAHLSNKRCRSSNSVNLLQRRRRRSHRPERSWRRLFGMRTACIFQKKEVRSLDNTIELLDRFDKKFKETHLTKKKVLFHHDNAPTHASGVVAAKLHEVI
ncbi:unnamed protein product [Acanthoscelides obtectus]|uniref:Transposase n=1 Tax=Acanthoscelides obtectus TaxID=200917 RepID=A0A9P0P1Y9_ACAOB|nr:unnamed protein product [Acanthoscelides obtectus]CAK1658693.1 hypothetical protein AOBTE_LOCUS21067 [Acanthoscelides obtectus]